LFRELHDALEFGFLELAIIKIVEKTPIYFGQQK
jgi:hypothetical protein